MRTSASDVVSTPSQCSFDGTAKTLLSRAFCKDRLTRMMRSVVGAADHDGKPVAQGSLTKSSSETAVCFCNQSSSVNLSKAAVSLLLTVAQALRSSVAERGSASTLSAFVIY